VIDQGRGIDESALARIFEPLEQAEHLSTRTHQGIGIGLSLARLSAHAMGGDVTLERTGPGGSTFLWSLVVPKRSGEPAHVDALEQPDGGEAREDRRAAVGKER
jgi:K+-sensing histidine kinase KdpD